MSLVKYNLNASFFDVLGRISNCDVSISPGSAGSAQIALQRVFALLSLSPVVKWSDVIESNIAIEDLPPKDAVNYNTYRLRLVDQVNGDIEYIYVPSANLTRLGPNSDSIPPTSEVFTLVKEDIQDIYVTRAGNRATLTAIDYIIQPSSIFPSQVGANNYAPLQTKTVTYKEDGDYIVSADDGYLLKEVDITVDVEPLPEQVKVVNITQNGFTMVSPDPGFQLRGVDINVNVPRPADIYEWALSFQGVEFFKNAVGTVWKFSISSVVFIPPNTTGMYYYYNDNRIHIWQTSSFGVNLPSGGPIASLLITPGVVPSSATEITFTDEVDTSGSGIYTDTEVYVQDGLYAAKRCYFALPSNYSLLVTVQ